MNPWGGDGEGGILMLIRDRDYEHLWYILTSTPYDNACVLDCTQF